MHKLAQMIGVVSTALLVLAAPAAAQDWDADPNYGSVSLAAGFQPDPFEVNVTAGGGINTAQSLGGSCRGYVSSAPDYRLYFEAGSGLPLIISANSEADTTLIVNGPDGFWYCDDDNGESGWNPALIFETPATGQYDIWIGTYNNAPAPARLSISEIYTY